MPKIIDPDDLVRDTSVHFKISDPVSRSIDLADSLLSASSLIPPLTSGSDSGVTLQALYSFCKEEWKSDQDLIRIPFPLITITPNQFDFVNSWELDNDRSREAIRDAGWSVISASFTLAEYVGIVSLGTLAPTDQVYYQQSNTGSLPVNFAMLGAVNQAIKQFSQSIDAVEFDSRAYTKIFVREYKKTFDDASIQDDLAVVSQSYIVYSLPLTNVVDLKIQTPFESEATGSPYIEVTIDYLTGSVFGPYVNTTTYQTGSVVQSAFDSRWYHNPLDGGFGDGAADDVGQDTLLNWITWSLANGGGERQIGSSFFPFDIIVDAGAGKNNTKEQVYTRVQFELRLATDIDDGDQDPATHRGDITDVLMSFTGDQLITANGVFIDNFQDADTNAIDFFDVSGSQRNFPFVSAGTINFNDNLVADLQAEFFMFFTSVPSGDFGTSNAFIVEDNGGLPITGSVSGSGSVTFTFDYDGNTQGGRSDTTDANVTVVAIGLNTAQYVSATGIIDRSKTVVITLVSSLERNYENPA